MRGSPAWMAIGSQVLALQAAEQAANDQGCVAALLDAIELGQVALEEAGEAVGTTPHASGREGRIVQEGLRLGMIQE